jgi:hypothetical protein
VDGGNSTKVGSVYCCSTGAAAGVDLFGVVTARWTESRDGNADLDAGEVADAGAEERALACKGRGGRGAGSDASSNSSTSSNSGSSDSIR